MTWTMESIKVPTMVPTMVPIMVLTIMSIMFAAQEEEDLAGMSNDWIFAGWAICKCLGPCHHSVIG
jgi:hypothetical protein